MLEFFISVWQLKFVDETFMIHGKLIDKVDSEKDLKTRESNGV